MKIVQFLIFSILIFSFSTPSFAQPTITMNGIDITGVTNQRFTNVTIEFDAHGNIQLNAPQYKVLDQTPTPVDPGASRQIQPSAQTLPLGAIDPKSVIESDSRPTYLVAEFNYPGLLGFNIDLSINGQLIQTIKQGNPIFVLDISKHLVKGKNTIQYRLVMAADSGTSSKATVRLHFSKQFSASGNTLELTGHYAPLLIEGIQGEKTYHVELIVE